MIMRSAFAILGIAMLTACSAPPKSDSAAASASTAAPQLAVSASPSPSPQSTAAVAPLPQRSTSATIVVAPASTVQPAAVPSIAPIAGVPQALPSPVPSGSPGALVSPAPSATPSPAIVRLAPNDPPQIVAVSVNKTNVHPGDVVVSNVETSSNVASVEVRIAGYSMNMSKVGVGRFMLNYTVPRLPFFLNGNYAVQVIARNVRGDAARRSLPITVR